MKDVNNREGLDSIQIFLYQKKALTKKQVCLFRFKMLELFSIWQVNIQPDASSVKVKAAHLWPVMNISFSLHIWKQKKPPQMQWKLSVRMTLSVLKNSIY